MTLYFSECLMTSMPLISGILKRRSKECEKRKEYKLFETINQETKRLSVE